MDPIVISRSYFFEGETDELTSLFESGLSTFHLYKPGADTVDLAKFLGQVPAEYRNRVILHDHSNLLFQYKLGGYHLTDAEGSEQYRDPEKVAHFVKTISEGGYKVSASIHDPVQQFDLPAGLKYIFLSPVFDSISKPGYKRNDRVWEIGGVNVERRAPLIALGGINAGNVQTVLDHGFDGIAVLGSVWNQNSPSDAWKNLRQVCHSHATQML
ncbi:MAG: thiamine-phosphate pyrophosphorylase [Limisphaerales bacterium]|jgi:thiamine-phosphate pyrophosphorylase